MNSQQITIRREAVIELDQYIHSNKYPTIEGFKDWLEAEIEMQEANGPDPNWEAANELQIENSRGL